MGERMSATVIASLWASAETPGMPPWVPSEHALADADGVTVAEPVDFTPTDLGETRLAEFDPTQTNLAGGIGEDPAQECPMPAVEESAVSLETQALGSDPDLWLYRGRTVGLLRRYMRLSIEVGRMPSLLGREFFRARITSYRAATFEDSVIFVHDVEVSLEKLNEFDKQLIAKVVLQEYSQEEAGRQLGCGLRHAARCYAEALDRVTEILLKRELLIRLPRTKPELEKSCQGGKNGEFPVSDSEQAKNKS
jgi:DNA-directed RNA polymerase specialized sigma24 family protein